MARNICRMAGGFIIWGIILIGCQTRHEIQTTHEVEMKPLEIKPIHITIDVNVRVEKALDSFFDDLEAAEDKIKE